ncbi:MAG: AAA family ATPase [Treponema sp.]|nr:AAA family ATPase [Treponema sp.]
MTYRARTEWRRKNRHLPRRINIMEKPFLIGIAGGTASGKSTFCEKLEKELNKLKLKVFHMDEYFKPESQRPYTKAFVTKGKYIDDNHPLTMDLKKLTTDVKESLKKEYNVIIIEGLLTLWDDDMYEMLDLKIYVDCRSDERIVRRIKRNTQWGQTFEQITNVYLDMVRFRHDEYVEPSKWRADIIINGSKFSEKALTMIAGYINNLSGGSP